MNLLLLALFLLFGITLPIDLAFSEDQHSPILSQAADFPETFMNSHGQRFVYIPGGTFQMGPLKPREEDQQPRHKVTLSSFYLGAFEVTKGQFHAFAKEMNIESRYPELDIKTINNKREWNYSFAPGDEYPLYIVDWNTATSYAKWLSGKDHHQYRLPTEAEWEYAARSGTETRYWWGENWMVGMAVTGDERADRRPYDGLYLQGVNPANPWGIYDILGNAAEWTADWYAAHYIPDQDLNPTGPSMGTLKVLRGGSVRSGAIDCFNRWPETPDKPFAGIRLVCEITKDFKPPPPPPAHISTLDRAPFQAAGARAADLTVMMSPGVHLDMMKINPGTYTMGSPATERGHGQLEEPLTKVTISHSFYLGRYPVTQLQYEAIKGVNPSRFKDPNRPVDQVSFVDAEFFCRDLTARERAAGRLSTDEVYRLPTDPEWEYACRAGSSTAYCYGDDPSDLDLFAWFDGRDGTHPVGKKLPNLWGLYDMHGNVQEWCWGSPSPPPGGAQIDPRCRPGALYETKPEIWDNRGFRTARGGGWNYGPIACRSAMRQGFKGNYDFIGFRIARASTEIDTSLDDQ
jgi:formylglycine-generating enzyme required for sulfatase activity